MQDRYAGDIGDYFKLALLRAVAHGRKIGVTWYRTEPRANEPRGDGRHIGYLAAPDVWRRYDPKLFEGLEKLVHSASDSRSISALEELVAGEGWLFDDSLVPVGAARIEWLATVKKRFEDREVIFADPDNGFAPDGYRSTGVAANKSITLEEIRAFASPRRSVIFYHHNSRRAGGHDAEIAHIGAKLASLELGGVCAIRIKPWSPRTYFTITPDAKVWAALENFAAALQPHASFYTISGPPDSLGLPPTSPYSERAQSDEDKVAKAIDAGEYDALFKDSVIWQRVIARRDRLA